MKVIKEDGLFFQVAWAINTLNSIHLQMIKILSYTEKEEGGAGCGAEEETTNTKTQTSVFQSLLPTSPSRY